MACPPPGPGRHPSGNSNGRRPRGGGQGRQQQQDVKVFEVRNGDEELVMLVHRLLKAQHIAVREGGPSAGCCSGWMARAASIG